jgi:hypothetical protein
MIPLDLLAASIKLQETSQNSHEFDREISIWQIWTQKERKRSQIKAGPRQLICFLSENTAEWQERRKDPQSADYEVKSKVQQAKPLCCRLPAIQSLVP